MILLYAKDNSMFENLLPSIISVSFTVLLFVISRKFEIKLLRKELKVNWYYKIIIEPNIHKIDDFIKELYKSIKKSINLLERDYASIPHKDFVIKKAELLEENQKITRKFENDFVLLVQGNFPEISEELTSFLLNIEDIVKNNLDLDKEKGTLNFDHIEKEINLQKNALVQILYKPIVEEKTNFNKRYFNKKK